MAAPRTPVMPDRESFCALAGDLVRDHVVDLPAYLLSGTIGPHATPLAFTNKMYGYFRALWAAKNEGRSEPEPPARLTDDKFTVDVRRLGDDLDTVLAGLYAAPIGAQDVCVLFSGLATPPGVEPPAHYTMPDNVGLFALRQPRSLYGEVTIWVDDGRLPNARDDERDDSVDKGVEMPAFTFLRAEENGGPWAFLPHVPSVFSRHWGEDFVTLVDSS